MLDVSNYQRSTNQSCNVITPHGSECLHNIKKFTNDKCWRGCGEKKTLLTLLAGIEVGAVAMGNSMEVPHKTKNRITM